MPEQKKNWFDDNGFEPNVNPDAGPWEQPRLTKPSYPGTGDWFDENHFDANEYTPATMWDRIKDVGVSGLTGLYDVYEAGVGLADIFTGGRVGKSLEDYAGWNPEATREYLNS